MAIINNLIWRLGRAKSVTQSGFEKCDRLFFKKSAVLDGHEWRPCHVEAGGQNGPLFTPFQVQKYLKINKLTIKDKKVKKHFDRTIDGEP